MRAGLPHALLVAFVAVLVRVSFLVQAWGSPLLRQHERVGTDMHFFWSWGQQVAAGDLLGTKPLHPWHGWHELVARQAHGLMGQASPYTTAWGQQLWDGWYGGLAFHQEPLYAYLLALLVPLGVGSIVLVQAAMGVLSSVLVWVITRRAFGGTAALIAGILAALYGPAVFYEAVVLRGPLEGLVLLVALWTCQRATCSSTTGAGLVAGLALGVAALTRSTALPLAVVAFFALRGRLRPSVALLAGLGLGLLPVVGRNLMVGVAPLALTSVGPVTFIASNAADYPPGTGFGLSTYTAALMVSHHDSLLGAAVASIASWSSPMAYAAFLFTKTRVLLSPAEIPNNLSYGWYSAAMPWPRLGWWWVALPAAGGILLAARRWRQALLPVAFAALALAPSVAFYNLSRFRTPAVFLLAPFAGLAVARGLAGLQSRKLAEPAVVLAAALLVALLGHDPVSQPIREIRATDVATQGTIFLAQARTQPPVDGLATIERALRAVPADDWVGEPVPVADAARQTTTDLWEACARLAYAAGDEGRAHACYATWQAR